MTTAAERLSSMHIHRLALHGLVVRIDCGHAEIQAALAARFASFPRADDTEADVIVRYELDAPPHEHPVDGRPVYESEHARVFYSAREDALYAFHDSGATMRCTAALGYADIRASSDDSERWVVTRPLLTLALMELARRRHLHPLHAACMARDGAGILVCGPSGAGKSTLTLALLEAGFEFLSDDLVFIDSGAEGVHVRGFPDELGLSADARTLFPRLPEGSDVALPGWPKARVNLEVVAPAAIASSCTPLVVLLLSEGADRSAIETVDRDAGLLELLPSILLTEPEACASHLKALASLTASATLCRTGARPDLSTVVHFVDRALPRPIEQRKDSPS